jgi:hypothetical protein
MELNSVIVTLAAMILLAATSLDHGAHGRAAEFGRRGTANR